MTTHEDRKKADADGHVAGFKGWKMDRNPYEEGHELHWFWLRGWVGARLEKHQPPSPL
jgi:ribosome modulation factor